RSVAVARNETVGQRRAVAVVHRAQAAGARTEHRRRPWTILPFHRATHAAAHIVFAVVLPGYVRMRLGLELGRDRVVEIKVEVAPARRVDAIFQRRVDAASTLAALIDRTLLDRDDVAARIAMDARLDEVAVRRARCRTADRPERAGAFDVELFLRTDVL